MGIRHVFAALVAVIVTILEAHANAQVLPSVDTRTWRPSTDPNASVVIEPAVTPGPGVLTVGAYAHYSFHPVTLRFAGSDDVALRPVKNVMGVDAFANYGIGQRMSVGLVVPTIIYQNGDHPLPRSVSEVDRLPVSAFGDVGLTMKGAILRNENGGFGLATLGYVSLPTGDRASFAGDGSTTVTARLLAEYTLLVAVAQASVGYKLRTDHHTWPDPSVGGIRFGDELPWSVGLAFRPGVLGVDSGNRQRWELGFHGWLPAGPVGPFGAGDPGSAALSPVLVAASDRIELGHYRDTFLTIGGEFGLTQAVGVPVFRGIVGFGWAPREHDIDHDRIRDDIDGCPDIPEDRDGFEDNDGCPEIDNDDDGIIDREDKCPNVKGEPSSDPQRNGCPAGGPAAVPVKKDTDQDGIDDSVDKCPTQAEDKDSFQDDDGCPDPDNDGDGIPDKEDACPNVAGEKNADPAKNGCTNVDKDGDTFENSVDKCPDQAEVFNGVDDEDGCPDEGGKALVTVDDKRNVKLLAPLKFIGGTDSPDLDPASIATVRALGLELNRHRDWTFAIGARPAAGGDASKAQLDALAKSFAVVRLLSQYTHRDGAAETVGWDAVKSKPQANETGMGILVLVMPDAGPAPPPAPPLPSAK
jgi:OmpA-OmpF porin, OOP family